MCQSMTLTQIVWISLSQVLILLKCHHLGISMFNREMIRILSHAEIFSFAALECLHSGNMDSRVFYGNFKSMSMTFMDSMSMVTLQTLGLQQMRREAAIESAPKALFLQRQRESFVLLLVPLSYC